MYGPTEDDFRKLGLTAAAVNYPLSDRAFAWLAKFNGVTVEQMPMFSNYAPNAVMQKYCDAMAEKEGM